MCIEPMGCEMSYDIQNIDRRNAAAMTCADMAKCTVEFIDAVELLENLANRQRRWARDKPEKEAFS
jgi:hypothetical protein